MLIRLIDILIFFFFGQVNCHVSFNSKKKKKTLGLIIWELNPLWERNEGDGGREIGDIKSAQSTVMATYPSTTKLI